jgi:hypothetical protein
MNHEHGPHECLCPNCGLTEIVDAYIKCNTLTCPGCGQPMRATETGEYRPEIGRGRTTRVTQGTQGGWGKVAGFAAIGGIALLFIWGLSKKKA